MDIKQYLYDQYLTIFENTGTGTILIDEDTTIVKVNNKFLSMLGYKKSEIEGKRSWTEFIHPDDVERMKRYHYLRRQNPDAAPKNYEFRIFTKDGKIRYIYLTIDMIPQTMLSVASLTDITSLVETREALRKSEEKYRMLIETMNDGLLVQNENFTIEYVNNRFCEIIGYDRSEIVGRPIEEFICTDYLTYFTTQMEKRRIGIQQTYELAWKKKDGLVAYTIVSPRIIFDSNNSFAGSFAVVTDITDRKEWELVLKRSEELFAAVFDATPVALTLVDMDTGEIVKANKLFRTMAHIENINKKVLLFELGLVKKSDIRKLYKKLLKLGKINDYEIQLNYNGGERIAILSAELIIIHNKRMVILSLTDITEKRMLEKELISISENERKSIGQDLHDDIIPHLIGIEVMVKALSQQLQKKTKNTMQDLDDIRRLLSLAIVKVRQLSKGLSPAYFISNQGLPVLLEEMCNAIQKIYGIQCHFEQNGIININDPTVLSQIYYIVQGGVHNAVKHSMAQLITVMINADIENVSVIIQDNGKGFDVATVDGMGLKIMKHRASSIAATLCIESAINRGTRIEIKLKNGDN
ncbi:MAG: PAS domain S-box protein [Spirochaetes bacterium]|nr:PAS domain S-box protein [Spirochaetota bacterium]